MDKTTTDWTVKPRHEVFAAVCLACFLYSIQDRVGPVARRSVDCAAAINRYRQLSESHGIVGDANYYRELAGIFYDYGFQGDGNRERNRAAALSQQEPER